MKCLVTGGAGFIGSHLVNSLANAGHSVTSIDVVGPPPAGRPRHDAATYLKGGLHERDVLAEAMAGAEVVFHLAARSRVMPYEQDPMSGFKDNVEGTFLCLNAAATAGVRKFVFASSREVYGNPTISRVDESQPCAPINHYGLSKVVGEHYCRLYQQRYGLDTSVARLSNVYGIGDSGRVIPVFVERAMRGEPLRLAGATKTLDFVHVSDVVGALRRLGGPEVCPGEVFNVGSGIETTLGDLADKIIVLAGGKSSIIDAPVLPQEVEHFCADTAKIEAAIGYKCKVNLLMGLTEIVQNQRKQWTGAMEPGAATEA